MSKVIHMRTVSVQHHVTPSRNRKPATVKPSIKLLGNWLRDAGFEPGDMATVVINNGVLTIKPEGSTWKQ